MEFEKVLAFRQSTRSFTEEKVSEKELTMIMNVHLSVCIIIKDIH